MEIDCITEYKKILNSYKSNFVKDMFLSDSIDKFKITKHKDGNYPAIITISGFTSEDKDNRKDWEKCISRIYPDREWFHLEWNSKKIPFDKEPMTKMPDILKTNEIKKPKYLKFIKYAVYRTNILLHLSDIFINNYWHVAVRNSSKTGECLAEILSACQKKEFVLIGHSLGARVIYNCLNHLYEKKLTSNIIEIHLLGGAVENDTEKWLRASFMVKKHIYNYYSFYDMVLTSSYRIGMLSFFPIGLYQIKNEKVVNLPSSRFIKGHTEYIKRFSIVFSSNSRYRRWKENSNI